MSERADPFEELEQLFEEFVSIRPSHRRTPPVDVVERDDTVVVMVDLPGRDASEIAVTLTEGRQLDISAPESETDVDGRYVTRERSGAALRRSVALPADVDDEGTEASYDDGVLTVTLQKREEEGGTDIPVE